MDKPKIFITGGSGLVGSRVIELLSNTYQVDQLSLTHGVDITDPETLVSLRDDTDHSAVIHMAAKADVDGCEADRMLGEEGDAYRINVQGTQNVVDACKPSNKKVIYISTDFVFDGEHTPEGGYTEEDKTSPLNWYAQTKFDGEERIRNSGLPYIIARIAYPFRKDLFELKKDFVHAIMGRLAEGKEIKVITDHVMTPTYLDDIAVALEVLIKQQESGIFHVVGSQSLTPYDAAVLIAEKFGYDKSLISETTREDYFRDKAKRPFDLSLNNAKIEKLGVTMKSFTEGLDLLI